MSRTDQKKSGQSSRSNDPMLGGQMSMSAPSPMPGKPAASYANKAAQSGSAQRKSSASKELPARVSRPLQPAQPVQQSQPLQAQYVPQPQGWNTQPQGYSGYPVQQGYQPPPSQGIPGGQLPPQQYGWQQGYQPVQPQQQWQGYQQPTGRGWTAPYPVQNQQSQQPWQGGYSAAPWGGGYAPGSGEAPGRSTHGGHGGNGGSQVDYRALLKLLAAAAVILFAVVAVVNLVSRKNETLAIREAVNAYNSLYCQGVYVDGIHLGGMTREEARAAVQKSAQLKCDEWNVQLLTGAGEYVGEINSYHLGMTVHVDDALEDAWAQGHTGATEEEKMAAMEALLVTPYHTSTALPSGDTEAIDRILGEIANSVYSPASDAYIATFTPSATNPFEIVGETVGRYLNVEGVKHQVYDMVSRMESGVVSVEPSPLYPNVTAEMLRQQTTLIGSHYTPISTTSTENRNKNIERACELINGRIIEPGKTFSFNGVVGARTKKNGFYTAIEYAYGKQVEGYGGGVCQVSSTIYVAAVRANMEIVKRTQHALEVNYTTFGLDATVNIEGKKIDFEFRNNTNSPIYIVTKVMKKPKIDKNHFLVICDIYGPALEPGVTYDLTAITTEVPIPEPTIVPDKKAEYATYTDEMVENVVKGKIGYEVDSYKIKYVNGEEAERTHMFHDTYKPVQPVHYVGVSERPLPTEDPLW